MKFIGISRNFSTLNDKQYETIGSFWDEMAEKYGLENLIGLGYKWENNTIDYAIGLKSLKEIPGSNFTMELPDGDWNIEKGETEKLDQLYSKICTGHHSLIKYELETFNEDGTCVVKYYKNEK